MAVLTALTPSPSTGGQTLTLTGTTLSTTSKVNFGAKSVTPSAVTATSVTCTVPALCAGQYNVSVTAGTATSNAPFRPTGGGAAVSAASVTPVSANQLLVTVPAGLTAGATYDLQVVTPGGISAAVAGDVFTGA